MTGNPLFDKILMGLNTLVALAVAGLMYYYGFTHQKPLPSNAPLAEEMKKDIEEKNAGFSALEVTGTIINLQSRTSRLRFLEVDIQIVPAPPITVEDLKLQLVFLKDILIQEGSQMTDEELSTVSGKILLEGRIKTKVAELYKRPAVEKIIFTKYVIQ